MWSEGSGLSIGLLWPDLPPSGCLEVEPHSIPMMWEGTLWFFSLLSATIAQTLGKYFVSEPPSVFPPDSVYPASFSVHLSVLGLR